MFKPKYNNKKQTLSFKINPEIINDREDDVVTGLKSKALDEVSLFIDDASLNSYGLPSCFPVCINENLSGMNLHGVSTQADFREADLSNADLTYANLMGIWLGDANLTGANLTGAFLNDADLSRANFTNANLTGAGLERVNLSNADLTNANLTNANLTQAAGTSTAIRTSTICPDGSMGGGNYEEGYAWCYTADVSS